MTIPPAPVGGVARAVLRGGETAVDTALGAVLVRGALPGERVTLEGVGKRGGALRGRVVSRDSESAERVAPPCPVQERCGGCPLMAWELAAQRAWKRGLVAEATGLEVVRVGLVTGAALGYRRRARLAVRGGAVGYRGARAHGVVAPERCVVLAPELSRALDAVRATLATKLVGDAELHLALRDDGRVLVALETRRAQPPAAYDACAALARAEGVAGVALRIGASAPATFGDVAEHTRGADHVALVAPAFSFSQAHEEVNTALVAEVVRLAEPGGARVLELYAGHGNLTVALARGARELLAVEESEAAASAGRRNVAARGLSHVRFVAGDAAALAAGPKVDVVVLDPPREGAKDALAGLAARGAARIVYVSCDTATLARDVRSLHALGYAPDAATALDMFPHTAHVEAVTRLVAMPRPSS